MQFDFGMASRQEVRLRLQNVKSGECVLISTVYAAALCGTATSSSGRSLQKPDSSATCSNPGSLWRRVRMSATSSLPLLHWTGHHTDHGVSRFFFATNPIPIRQHWRSLKQVASDFGGIPRICWTTFGLQKRRISHNIAECVHSYCKKLQNQCALLLCLVIF